MVTDCDEESGSRLRHQCEGNSYYQCQNDQDYNNCKQENGCNNNECNKSIFQQERTHGLTTNNCVITLFIQKEISSLLVQ